MAGVVNAIRAREQVHGILEKQLLFVNSWFATT